MYILKNAWLNITRNKGRNILIGIVLVVIGCACTIALAIKNTSNTLIKSYKDAYAVTATIGLDRSSMMQGVDMSDSSTKEDMKSKFDEISNISVSDVKKYAKTSLVKDYYYTYSLSVNSSNITKTSSNMANDNHGPEKKEETTADFTLMGYNSAMSMTDFIKGNYTITSKTTDAWTSIFDGYNCFINKELADANKLSLGDEIKFVDPNDSSAVYTFKIVGIFKENNTSTSSDKMDMFSSSANTIITNTSILEKIDADNNNLKGKVTPTFILNSYKDVSKFQKQLYKKGMSKYLTVSTNEEEVTRALSSISNVSSFATVFLIITLIIGAIVLFIINQINIRERKYEIGVLRTIGMKKKTLNLQFLTELLMVSVMSLMIGILGGVCLAKPVSNKLLQNEISSSSASMNKIEKNFGKMDDNSQGSNSSQNNSSNQKPSGDMPSDKFQGQVSVQAYDSINAVVDLKVVLELLAIGVVLTLISSISSTISIQRFTPLEILKERS